MSYNHVPVDPGVREDRVIEWSAQVVREVAVVKHGLNRHIPFRRFQVDVRAAVEKAEAFLDAVEKHEWQKAEELAGPRAGWQLDAERLADAWAQVIALGGELERRGTPTPLALLGGVVVVEEPLHMEAAELVVARVSYNRDGDMVGLWFLPSGQMLAGEQQ